MASVLSDVADLVSALAWPAVILAVLWLLRAPLRALADRIATSAQKVTIGAQGLSVELSSSVDHVPGQASTALAGVRQPDPAPRVVDSAALTMFAQLDTELPAPYLVVDLGAGREWLSSRLLIFAALLRSMRQTRVLVFVETAGTTRGRFVGLAAPETVRWALAHAYPWLERAFASSYAQATAAPAPGTDPEPFVSDAGGRLRSDVAHRLTTNFVFAVQQGAPPAGGAAAIAPPDWVVEQRPGEQFAEHASWLTGGDIEQLLGDALHRFAYVRQEHAAPPADSARAALRLPGEDVVALVDEQHRFRDLVVNRREVLEVLAADAVEADDAGALGPSNGRATGRPAPTR
jgi:hypothetical protein